GAQRRDLLARAAAAHHRRPWRAPAAVGGQRARRLYARGFGARHGRACAQGAQRERIACGAGAGSFARRPLPAHGKVWPRLIESPVMSDVVLYSYNISPYAVKVRTALTYKGIAFSEQVVHPLRRGIVKQKSGQILVPVLEHDGRVVHDSTRILAYLDEKFPEKPILPADALLRGHARLLQEWAAECLRTVVPPVRCLSPLYSS